MNRLILCYYYCETYSTVVERPYHPSFHNSTPPCLQDLILRWVCIGFKTIHKTIFSLVLIERNLNISEIERRRLQIQKLRENPV